MITTFVINKQETSFYRAFRRRFDIWNRLGVHHEFDGGTDKTVVSYGAV